MKVKIGKYVPWIGPYQLAEKILFFLDKEESPIVHSFGEYLASTKLSDVLSWLYSKQKRIEKVKIHNYDVWNAYHTISLIVYPLLCEMKKDKHGAPQVENEDVPEELRCNTAELTDKDGWATTDEKWFDRWDYVLDEMIWTFDQIRQSKEDGIDFWSGEFDIDFQSREDGTFLMVDGPKHTAKFDKDGYELYRKRIDNGLRLFSKYYFSLWT